MRPWLRGIVPLLLLAPCACADYFVATSDAKRVGTKHTAPSTMKGWLSRDDVEARECRTGIEDVRVRRDFGQGLVTILTLGLISPMKVEYYCSKAEAPEGELGGGTGR